MAKCQFFIKNGVQDVGYRLFIMQKILNSTLTGGTAINTPDGRVKVLLEGEREEIEQLIKELEQEHPELAKNPTRTSAEYNPLLHVPDIMRSSLALQLGQFQKSVEYLAKSTQSTNQKLDHLTETTNQKLDHLTKTTETTNQKLDHLTKTTETTNQKLDQLPKEIAKELSGKFDALPLAIAKAIKEENALV